MSDQMSPAAVTDPMETLTADELLPKFRANGSSEPPTIVEVDEYRHKVRQVIEMLLHRQSTLRQELTEVRTAAVQNASDEYCDLMVRLGSLLDSLGELTDRRFRIVEVMFAPGRRTRVTLSADELTVSLSQGGDVIVFADGLQANAYELRCDRDGLDSGSMEAMESILLKLKKRNDALDAAAEKVKAEAAAESESKPEPTFDADPKPKLTMEVDVVAALLHAVMAHGRPAA